MLGSTVLLKFRFTETNPKHYHLVIIKRVLFVLTLDYTPSVVYY